MLVELPLPEGVSPLKPGKILCIGRNYAAHAAEMKSAVPEEPMVFLKPSTALIGDGDQVVLPAASRDVHHEVELVAVIGRRGRQIAAEDALDHVVAYAVGLDMTARDLQARAKAKGHPWSVAKGFDTFAPLGPCVAATRVPDVQDLAISLAVNGDVRQQGTTRDMMFGVAELIAYASTIFTLMPGDLLYTGTPAGVGPVQVGDTLVARIADWPALTVQVAR